MVEDIRKDKNNKRVLCYYIFNNIRVAAITNDMRHIRSRRSWIFQK